MKRLSKLATSETLVCFKTHALPGVSTPLRLPSPAGRCSFKLTLRGMPPGYAPRSPQAHGAPIGSVLPGSWTLAMGSALSGEHPSLTTTVYTLCVGNTTRVFVIVGLGVLSLDTGYTCLVQYKYISGTAMAPSDDLVNKYLLTSPHPRWATTATQAGFAHFDEAIRSWKRNPPILTSFARSISSVESIMCLLIRSPSRTGSDFP